MLPGSSHDQQLDGSPPLNLNVPADSRTWPTECLLIPVVVVGSSYTAVTVAITVATMDIVALVRAAGISKLPAQCILCLFVNDEP